jgi:formylglycine-generating enzyme required for sulfatase activity
LGLAVALGAVWLQKERGLRNRAEAAEKLAQRRLGEVQSERDRASEEQQRAEEAQQVAEVAQREVEQQLTEVLRFSDGLRVRELMEQADQLWPMHPDRIPAYQDWLQQAEELQARLPAQRSSLLRLLELARGETSEHLEGLPAPTEVGELAQDPELHWRYATSWELIQNLEALQRVFQDVQERLAFARSLPETLQEHQESWDDARFFLAESLSYGQLDLAPQLGLVPLGADPVSDLWEFCVVGSGSVPERDSASGELLLTPNTGLVLVLIPGDSFLMGSQDEHPGKDNYDPDAGGNEQVHRLHLDSFFLSKYEMTQGQWRRLTGDSPSFYGAQRVGEGVDHHPVEQVSATECSTVLGRLGLQLPTEAQWEYAVRAGTQTVFHSGDRAESLEGYANLADEGSAVHYSQDWEFEPGFHDGFVIHSPVGSLNPNDFGLHDMHGNVFEWCRDAYADYAVDPAPGDGLRVAASGQRTQALRGGSFGRPALHARAAIRHHKAPGERSRSLGLRPARPLHDLGN